MRNARAIFGILALTLASTSCLRQKTQARVFIPPPAQRLDAPKAATPPATPEPAAPPKLAQMFTPEEFRENTKTLEDSLERVARALAMVEGKNLTADQKEIVERIRTFRKQAEQAREEDLLTAVSLAKRADLLAKDLLERLP